jgi:hypothetical protein
MRGFSFGRRSAKVRGSDLNLSDVLPLFVIEPSNGRVHGAGATGLGAIRITNLGTVNQPDGAHLFFVRNGRAASKAGGAIKLIVIRATAPPTAQPSEKFSDDTTHGL